MINIVWFVLIFSGFIYSLLTGNVSNLNQSIFNSGMEAFNIILGIMPMIVLWMGLLNIGANGGILKRVSDFLYPFLSKIFPNLKKGSKALDYISNNIAANMLGLGSAATPFGLKAMQELQRDNPNKDTATTEMITFLVLNTSGVTIIPTTVIALRISYHSINPEGIIMTSILATVCSTTFGLLLDYLIRRRK
jgi:spore maturation protein A